MIRVLHLTTHLNTGGITSYIKLLTKEMQRMSYEFFVASSGGSHQEKLEDRSVKCTQLNIRTKSELSPKLYAAVAPLIRFIRENKIDLMHAHTRVTQVLSWWVQRFSGTPYVSTCHGFYKRRLGRRILPAWGDHVIAISIPVGESLMRDFGVKSEHVTTIFNAVDVADLESRYRQKNSIEIRQKHGISLNDPVIGIVARIVEDKGHEYFLRAAARLVSGKFPGLKLLIVGDGPYFPQVRELAKRLKLDHAAFFLGSIEDVTYALAAIDIFILPAIWREGFGLSIVEAMAVRKPVIVTNIWALNELVQDGVNGLLVNPKDVDALAGAIEKLLIHRDLYDQISANGYAMVKREFSISRMAARMDELYRRTIQRRDENRNQRRSEGSRILT